jgi:DNA replication protein DnaC
MQSGLGFELRLHRYLHKTFGAEWCAEHKVLDRNFNDLIHDPEIRPRLDEFTSGALKDFSARVRQVEDERTELLRSGGDGKERYGLHVPLEKPQEMLPFAAMEPLPELADAITACRNWAFGIKTLADPANLEDNGEFYPPFLVLNGIPGCGKTRLAKAACCQLWDRSPVLFITEAKLVQLLHDSLTEQNIKAVDEELLNIPNLILDDYGAAALTPGSWGHGKRDEILSYRWEMDYRTLVTTNLKSAEIRENSPRLASRMMDRTKAVNVGIQAPDYRLKVR